MKIYLVRDSSDYENIYFIIKLEDEKYWTQAKEYMCKKREEEDYEYYADSEIMEEYWQNNNINYEIIDLPKNELFL